mmetsp:Transcript_41748/g.94175  ORF Transcript_41748/g.94175 Transcript_41748/m.94175 type:complete len:205 (-) Transcript_41748:219-833(-)
MLACKLRSSGEAYSMSRKQPPAPNTHCAVVLDNWASSSTTRTRIRPPTAGFVRPRLMRKGSSTLLSEPPSDADKRKEKLMEAEIFGLSRVPKAIPAERSSGLDAESGFKSRMPSMPSTMMSRRLSDKFRREPFRVREVLTKGLGGPATSTRPGPLRLQRNASSKPSSPIRSPRTQAVRLMARTRVQSMVPVASTAMFSDGGKYA